MMVAIPLVSGIRARCRTCGRVAMLVLFAAAPALAQTNTQATITGAVPDESGAVLPGVSVTAISPSLQVGQVAGVTDPTGEYRISGLPIGTYEVTYTLEGFQTIRREDVRLTAG